MDIDIMWRDCCGSAYNMKLVVLAYFKPGVLAVFKWFRYYRELHHIPVKIGTFFKVYHIYRGMVKRLVIVPRQVDYSST